MARNTQNNYRHVHWPLHKHNDLYGFHSFLLPLSLLFVPTFRAATLQ